MHLRKDSLKAFICFIYTLTFSTLSSNPADDKLMIISCKLYPKEKCEILFSGKNKKKKIFQNVVCWNFYLAH